MNDFEIEILNKIQEVMSEFLRKFFLFLTNLGGQEILIVAIIVVYFIVSKKQGQRIAFAIFSSLLINNALKVIINRDRPFKHPNRTYDVDSVEASASGMSFPSGHSQNAAVSYSSIAFTYKKRYLWIAAIFLIFLVALSRIMLGVHYPTDVIVGVILGLLIAYFGMKLYDKFAINFRNKMLLYIIVAIIFLPFLFIYISKMKASYFEYKDLYTIYAFYIGYVAAVFIEGMFVDFDESVSLKLRVVRAVIAIIIVLGLLLGLKAVFPKDKVLFDMLRYFLLSFITIGVYPICLKKSLFKKAN